MDFIQSSYSAILWLSFLGIHAAFWILFLQRVGILGQQPPQDKGQ